MTRILFLRPLLLLTIAIMASLFVAASSPVPVMADNVSEGLNQLKNGTNGAYPTTAFGDKKTPSQILGQIISIALGIGFAIAVIMVIYGGFQYITSAGNEEKATAGRQTLIYALIGLVIILLSFVIVTAVVNFINKGDIDVSGNSNSSNTNTTPPPTPGGPSGNRI